MSQPMEFFETQNLKDDDAQVIDSLFLETDSPPDLKELNEPILIKWLPEPKRVTRLLSSESTIDPAWSPYQLLPADANRKSLQISVYSTVASPVASDGVRLSDDLGTIRTAGKILHGATIPLDQHTGPVYVIATGAVNGSASAPVTIQYWSVTE